MFKSEFPLRYFVVRESRPHTHAPHIVHVRYLCNGGGLDSSFNAALRFDNQSAALYAATQHAHEIIDSGLEYPAPPETKLEVIECSFALIKETSAGDAVQEDIAFQYIKDLG